EIEKDLDQTKKEIQFRNTLGSTFDQIESSLVGVFIKIQDSLIASIETDKLSDEAKKDLIAAFLDAEKESAKAAILQLIQKSGELLHTLDSTELIQELKAILVQGTARATRQYFEW